MHFEDATPVETNPYLSRVWHRIGTQPTVPAAGTNRRLTIFGSVEAPGRGRVEVLQARQDAAGSARDRPHLNPKEPEWRRLKRDHRGHLAPTLREFVAAVVAGVQRLGGDDGTIIDAVPQWWLDGHRKEPTGRPRGRPKGATDRHPRTRRVTSLPAGT